jgi:hypothetical protein
MSIYGPSRLFRNFWGCFWTFDNISAKNVRAYISYISQQLKIDWLFALKNEVQESKGKFCAKETDDVANKHAISHNYPVLRN